MSLVACLLIFDFPVLPVSEKNTPPEKEKGGKYSFQNTKSGAGDQFLRQWCRAKACGKILFASQPLVTVQTSGQSPPRHGGKVSYSALTPLPVSVKNTLLLRKPLPCSPVAETAIQPLTWCSESPFFSGGVFLFTPVSHSVPPHPWSRRAQGVTHGTFCQHQFRLPSPASTFDRLDYQIRVRTC